MGMSGGVMDSTAGAVSIGMLAFLPCSEVLWAFSSSHLTTVDADVRDVNVRRLHVP